MSLDASKTRTQDIRNLFRFYTSTALGRMVTLQFLLTNWVEINNRYILSFHFTYNLQITESLLKSFTICICDSIFLVTLAGRMQFFGKTYHETESKK